MSHRRAAVATVIAFVFAFCLLYTARAIAAELIKARDGSGIFGYKDTPILPWCG